MTTNIEMHCKHVRFTKHFWQVYINKRFLFGVRKDIYCVMKSSLLHYEMCAF